MSDLTAGQVAGFERANIRHMSAKTIAQRSFRRDCLHRTGWHRPLQPAVRELRATRRGRRRLRRRRLRGSGRRSAPRAPRPRARPSACGCPSATSARDHHSWALELARMLGDADRGGGDHRGTRGARLLPGSATRRSRPCSPTTSRAGATKLVRSPPSGGMIVFSLFVEPARRRGPQRAPCRPRPYRRLIAATNMKQRVRKLGRVQLGRPTRLRGGRGPRTCSSTTKGSS